MANIFKAKTLLSRTGIFSHEAIAQNLVYNTGDQNINGNKTFLDRFSAKTGFFGDNNFASGDWIGISAGSGNYVSGNYSFIGGGYDNRALGNY